MAIVNGNAINAANKSEFSNSSRVISGYGSYASGVSSQQFSDSVLNGVTTAGCKFSAGNVYVDLGAPIIIDYVDLYIPTADTSTINDSGVLFYNDYNGSTSNPETGVGGSWTDMDTTPTTGVVTSTVNKVRYEPGSPVTARWFKLVLSAGITLNDFQAIIIPGYSADTGDVGGFAELGTTSGVPLTATNGNYPLTIQRTTPGSATTPQQVWIINTGSGTLYSVSAFVVHDASDTNSMESQVEIALTSGAATWNQGPLTVPDSGIIASGDSAAFWVRTNAPSGTSAMAILSSIRVAVTRQDI